MRHTDFKRRTQMLAVVLMAMAWALHTKKPPPSRPTVEVALEGGGALGSGPHRRPGVVRRASHPDRLHCRHQRGRLGRGNLRDRPASNEIHQLVTELDWNKILSSQPVYRDLSYRRKEDLRTFQNYLDFGLRKGFTAQSGLNSGQEITFLLDRLVLPYSDSDQDFDRLPPTW
jgi:hypothetical protein